MTNSRGISARISETIRVELGRRRMSVNALARSVDLPQRTVARWVSGELDQLKMDDVETMARGLGMTLEELLAKTREVTGEEA